MDLYNNKTNDKLKFKLNAEGINTNDIEPRLVFNSNDKINYIIFGDIKEGICYFNIPELKIYESNSHGSVKFELVSKDLYFKVWEDKFTIKTKSTIKIEEMVREVNKDEKPKINVILENDFIEPLSSDFQNLDFDDDKDTQKPYNWDKKETDKELASATIDEDEYEDEYFHNRNDFDLEKESLENKSSEDDIKELMTFENFIKGKK